MGKIISFRLSNEKAEMMERKYGGDIAKTAKELLLEGKADHSKIVTNLTTIHSNQRIMSNLSNENKKLWKEIRQELGIA